MAKSNRSIQDQLRSFCAYQERSRFEVEQKLYRLNVSRDRWDSLMGELEAEGFLNEDRFVRAYVRGKFRMKGWGKWLIRQGLMERRIPSELINEALESEIEEGEYVQSTLAWVEKSGLNPRNEDEFNQLLEKLYRKGYSRDDLESAIRTLG